MSDEVRDMIRTALADEPASGLEFERVVRDGRKRRARRRFGALTTAAVGVVAVAAVTVTWASAPASVPPAGVLSTSSPTSVTSSATSTPGCAVPELTGGFPDQPRGSATPEELTESGRLTEAFQQFALPLPAGVEATSLRLCAINESWGGDFRLTGDRTVIVYVRSLGGQSPGECVLITPRTQCSIKALPDGSTARVTVEPGEEATLAHAEVWRADDTYVRVLETGGRGSQNRVLDDDRLVAIATAPQLRVQWAGRSLPSPQLHARAVELGLVLAGALPVGVQVEATPAGEALRFAARQGGYRAVANLADAAGRGWVMVNLGQPDGGEVSCADRPRCRLVELSNGRKGALETTTEGGLTRLSLTAKAADGTVIGIQTSNAAEGSATPTRPTPPLAEADLVRIANLPGLHW